MYKGDIFVAHGVRESYLGLEVAALSIENVDLLDIAILILERCTLNIFKCCLAKFVL